MKKITSTTNETIKLIQKLHQKKYRKELGLFLLEGKKSVLDAIDVGFEIKEIFILEDSKLVDALKHYDITLVDEKVMKRLTTTETPPEIAAVAKQLSQQPENLKNCKHIALYENIKDAGNLGTIIRSALAFDIDAIILLGDTVDLYNPKLIRSTVGTFGKLPIINLTNVDELKQLLPSHKFIATILGADSKPVAQADFNLPFVLMFGEEACGLSKELIQSAHQKIKLEMSDRVESLNLASASSIFFWEILRLKP